MEIEDVPDVFTNLLAMASHKKKIAFEEAKRREKLILELIQESDVELEQKGKLWGEKCVSELISILSNGSDDGKWETDFEARLFFHARTPEKAVIVKEAFEIARRVILKWWSEKQLIFFCTWLETTSWEELALEVKEYTPRECVELIRGMVSRIRAEAGTNPKVFPFSTEVDPKWNRKIRNKKNYLRCEKGKSTPADPANRIYLSAEERSLSVDALRDFLSRKYKVELSRATAARTKKRGWFMRPGWTRGVVGEKVFLSPEERNWSTVAISRKYGISETTAALARKRGYFFVNKQNKDKVIPKEIEGKLRPVRVTLSLKERKFSSTDLVKKYGISLGTARKAINRGWFEARHELQVKWKKEGKNFLRGGEDEN